MAELTGHGCRVWACAAACSHGCLAMQRLVSLPSYRLCTWLCCLSWRR